MKTLKNQWLWTMPYPSERLSGATRRGPTMAPEGQKPSQWRCLTKLPREMYSQPIVHKALSWGAIRKSACILTEITIRKSQFLFPVAFSYSASAFARKYLSRGIRRRRKYCGSVSHPKYRPLSLSYDGHTRHKEPWCLM